ncbi:MAG: metallophosphoesterase [Bacteroidales bacterium]
MKIKMIMLYVLIFLLVVDIYTFKGLRLLLLPKSTQWVKYAFYIGYWSITLVMFLTLILLGRRLADSTNPQLYKNMYNLGGVFLMLYLPKLVFSAFHLLEDIAWGLQHSVQGIKTLISPPTAAGKAGISRLAFLSRTGLVMAALPFTGILYGMVKGRFDYRTEHITLHFTNLPAAFDGLKIVQISDIHIGSYWGHKDKVKGAIEKINEQDADILLLTGDLVNNFASELEGWRTILGSMKARMGKYSILGNHDYGDYHQWDSKQEKAENLMAIKQAHEQMGFNLLLNNHMLVTKNTESVAIAGVENWGKPPFPQYGNLASTLEGIPSDCFTILMSHDPSHWDEEILGKTNIPITFSGHTHGMQFGINLPYLKWSPVKYRYPRWAGLYQEMKQSLYVNRGFGYIGYPGRVGMTPEITVMTLKKAAK